MRSKDRKTFAHGIHPPESKDDTSGSPIRQFPFAPVQVVPLSQHIGKPAIAEVSEGQEVVRGQRIARADGFVSVSMHAPVSGTVRRIGLAPAITGRMTKSIFIEPFPGSTQEIGTGTPCDAETATPDEIIAAIQNAGVVGLGGAGFPTHAKLKIPDGKHIDTLLINGAECEPYLTTDHRVMLEHAAEIFAGIPYLMKATGAPRCIIAVEANKPDAADALRKAIPKGAPITVEVLQVKYPQGAEKMLITALLGRQIPSGGLPLDVNALCVNVGTTAEIGWLLPRGMGIQERVITVGGPGVKNKGNYRIPIGTPLRFVLQTVGTEIDITRVFLGGPMMGQAVSSLDIPVTKGTCGVIAFTESQTGFLGDRKVYPCIRCGACVDACPIFLNPSQLGLLSRAEEYDRMAEEYHLMDCFECGSCTYVCPSHIPLVQQFRIAKGAVEKGEGGGPMTFFDKTLEIRSSPHIASPHSVDSIMFNVVLALLPITAFSVYAFGLTAICTLGMAIAACVLTEHAICRLADKPTTVGDWSAVICGLLYGLTLPPGIPLWMVAAGGIIAIGLGKALFGGLGYNPFNPALVGRAVLQAAFPVAMTTWPVALGANRFSHLPASVTALPFAAPLYDGTSGATPLSAWKFDRELAETSDLLMGYVSGSTGETCALLILLGGAWLISRRMMNWRIPAVILLTVAVFSGILHLVDSENYASPLFMLLSGGLMLGAVFMATDMVSSPMTSRGVVIYSVLIGVLVVVIRVWGGMPEGVMYAILLGNALTPHIDNLMQPRIYGARKPEEAS